MVLGSAAASSPPDRCQIPQGEGRCCFLVPLGLLLHVTSGLSGEELSTARLAPALPVERWRHPGDARGQGTGLALQLSWGEVFKVGVRHAGRP